jgi:hypothetical protein
MDGWTLSTIDEPEDESTLERIDAELERLAAGASDAPCDETGLLEGLAALLTGSPLDVVWRVLRAEARDPTARRH